MSRPENIARMECSICGSSLMYKTKCSEIPFTDFKIAVVGPCVKCFGDVIKQMESKGGDDGISDDGS